MKDEVIAGCVVILVLAFAVSPADAQDANAGGADFKQRCQGCHTGQPGSFGPNLTGVVGRKAASTDFNYSVALKNSNLTWDDATLDKFLTAPAQLVPGTRMLTRTGDATQRANLIAYLNSKK